MPAGRTATCTSSTARSGFAPRAKSGAARSSPTTTTPTARGSSSAAAVPVARRCCEGLLPARLRLVAEIDESGVFRRAVPGARRRAARPRLQPAGFFHADAHANAAAARRRARRRRAGGARRIEPWRHARDSRGVGARAARRSAGAARAGRHLREARPSPAAAGAHRGMAPPRRAAVLPLRRQRRARFAVHLLRGQPAVRPLQCAVPSADARLSGAARRVGRPSDGRGVREDAAERDVGAPRRRSPADREPAADVDRHPRVSRRGRRMRIALVVAAIVAFSVQGSAPATIRVGLAKPGGGFAIVEMPIETYVARVVAGEAARDSRAAALEALAITVRTFAAANLGRHRADGFDLCDQTHCQVLRPGTSATEQAAQRTAGRVLLHDGAPASIYYTASCGGRTEIPSAVWPGAPDPSYLPSKRDDACGGNPVWTAEVEDADLLRAFHAAGFRGLRLHDIRIVARDGSGRIARLQLD